MTKITLCYDIVSPWSLFAYKILQRYRSAWDYELILRPIFLGGVMKESGNRPPVTVKNKGKWMSFSDMPIFSDMSNIPYKFPETFPINTIQCMRFLRAVQQLHPEKLEKATDLFWDLFWNRSQGHSAKEAIDPTFFSEKFVSSGLFSQEQISKILDTAQSEEIKGALKDEAADLVNKDGAFGFPWIIVEKNGGEAKRSFFGADRFEHIAFFLGKTWNGPRGPTQSTAGRSKL
ncbi:hypothetical protein JCM16303_000034 [Sporobolomyces ruberrimus]